MLIFVNSERCFVFSAELVVVALETQIIERQHGLVDVAVVNVLINVEVADVVAVMVAIVVAVIVAVVAACAVIHGVIIITVLIILSLRAFLSQLT